eukprot:COSAG01_NODE_13588_length_1562_cov_26.902939_1_plen_502_part_01
MATIFSAPQIGDPRATGIKNGGIKAFESDIVYPVSRLTTPDGTWSGGKQLEFRWRSDSSRFWSPRDTKLYVKYKVGFGPKASASANGAPQNLATPAGVDAVKNVRITAAPNTSLFDGGVRYLQNSVVVENQTQPYSACMAQLLTKTDVAGTDTGVAGMLSLRKDVGKKLGSGIFQPDLVANTTSDGLAATAAITLHADSRGGPRAPSVAQVATAQTLSDVDDGADTLRRVVGATTFTATDVLGVDAPYSTTITDISNANPAVVTSTNHGLGTGDVIRIVDAGDMKKLLGAKCKVTVVDANSFTLDGVNSTDTSTFTAFGSADGRFQLEQYDPDVAGVLDLPLNVLGDALASGGGSDNKFDNTNPKQEILTLGKGTFEIAEPMFLASWQHGYAVGPSDHQLFLTINPEWQNDLLHCPAVGASGDRDYTSVLPMPKDGNVPTPAVKGAVYVSIESVEMHVSYVSPAQAFIPPSQSLRFSQYQVTTRKLHGNNIQESIVVPPGVR